MNIHEHMAERVELAATYAQDGAFHTAADILRKLADDLKAHAEWIDKAMREAGA